ncbi:hypothetical protein FRC01_014159, partial [Tulasnella sp. 417]
QLNDRIIIIRRHEGKGTHEAMLLHGDATVEAIKTHLRAGGSTGELLGSGLSVEKLPAHRYLSWRSRLEADDVHYL